MTDRNQRLGAYGEQVAARYLIRMGMAVLDRNWRTRTGELDIVARDGRDVVFVEVKTRTSRRFGAAVEAIVPARASRLRRLAAQWLAVTGTRHREIRFDIVSVYLRRSGGGRIEHLRGAF